MQRQFGARTLLTRTIYLSSRHILARLLSNREALDPVICPYGSDLGAPSEKWALFFEHLDSARWTDGPSGKRTSGCSLGGKEADDGPGPRLLAEVEFCIRGHLGMFAADEASVPEPPALGSFGHRLAFGLDELTAIVIVAAPGGVPAVGQRGPGKEPGRRNQYRPCANRGHSGQAFPRQPASTDKLDPDLGTRRATRPALP